jgi:hypothetical protein
VERSSVVLCVCVCVCVFFFLQMFPWVLEALAADTIRSLLVLFFVPVYADFGCFRASFGNFDEGIAFHSAA